jgi:hypothetical protein
MKSVTEHGNRVLDEAIHVEGRHVFS